MFETIGFFDKAADCYLQCKKFDRAIECAQNVRPMEMQNILIQKIQQHKKAVYIDGGKLSKLVESGDMSGLELMAQRGQWDECLNAAQN